MAHLVEIQASQDLPSELHVRVGDLLIFGASGGRLLEGGTTVEMQGVFSTGVLSDDGRVLSPVGPPTSVLFRAFQPGHARIELIRGDPWQANPQREQIAIIVAA